MTFLPIVERELRVRARHKATFRIRIAAAAIASLVIVFFLFTIRGRVSGHWVFWFLSGLAFIWCLFEGPRNTADAISEEKRDGTLGLLFLTDLKGYDVVLGKLLATSLNSFYAVLAILPPLAIPILFGGVTGGEFWRMVLLLLVTLLFSLSSALLISSASRNERRAWTAAVLLIGFLAVVPPLFRWAPAATTRLLGLFSPTPAFYGLADGLFARSPNTYWTSIVGVHVVTWGFLVAACLVLPRAWQDKPTQQANREITVGRRLQREVDRRRSMHLNPIVWMLTRGARADWYVWAVIALVVVPAIIIALVWKAPALLFPSFVIVAVILNLLLAAWVAAKACFMIADARAAGALDLLLTTPIRPAQIVDGHMEALKRQFVAPFAALCIAEVAMVALLRINDVGDLALAVVLTLVGAGLMAAQLMSSAWFGLWAGLTTKKSGHAVAKTILIVIAIPTLMMACWCLWPLIAIVKDAVLINYARSRLHQQFRNIVTEGAPVKIMPWSRPGQWPPKLPNVLEK